MKKNLLFLIAMAFSGQMAFCQEVVVKDDDLKENIKYHWTSDNTYILDGYVFLEEGGELTIDAGTVIKGKANPTNAGEASALFITRGARIFANGEETKPIIFTAEADDVNDPADLDETDRGLWGGLVLLGRANVSKNGITELNVEGLPSTEVRGLMGGTDDADNSGRLKYVSIRHAGDELSVGNELNGLTLGAVGSGTELDFIEIFASSDDGIEFFGGSPNLTHACMSFCSDDAFDWDLGFRGKGQYWFSIQAGDEGDNGMELDGADPDGEALFSNPTVYNLTLIGSGTTAAAANATGVLMRDATAGKIKNAIVTEFAHEAIEVEDLVESKGVDSRKKHEDGDLQLENITFFGFANRSEFTADATKGIVRTTAGATDDASWLVTYLKSTGCTYEDPMLQKVDRTQSSMLDPRPKANSPVLGASKVSALPSGDVFFKQADYRGAFSTDSTQLWVRNWTALATMGYLREFTTVGINETPAISDVNIYPNPASEQITVSYNLPSSSRMTITITDVAGKVVSTVNNNQMAGNQKMTINISNLNSGVYFCQFNTGNGLHTEKFIVK